MVNQYDHLMKTDGFATAEKLKNSFLGIEAMDCKTSNFILYI
ncbi:hypothetical protein CCYN49044_100030 [Capnocytophaga cynodegmi]|nr:hypothetical protein CCYN49044_100030 [Capnocytophaga cynodegmi]